MKTKNVQFLKQSEFHLRHLGKDLSQARPLTSDVSHCVRVTLILKVVLSKCKKLEDSLKSIKDLVQNKNCTEITSDEQNSLDHGETRLTPQDEFGSTPFQLRWWK